MIPTAIVLGFVLGLLLRWWAVPVVGVIWGVIMLTVEPGVFFGAVALGAVNALVGAVPAIAIRRATTKLSRAT